MCSTLKKRCPWRSAAGAPLAEPRRRRLQVLGDQPARRALSAMRRPWSSTAGGRTNARPRHRSGSWEGSLTLLLFQALPHQVARLRVESRWSARRAAWSGSLISARQGSNAGACHRKLARLAAQPSFTAAQRTRATAGCVRRSPAPAEWKSSGRGRAGSRRSRVRVRLSNWVTTPMRFWPRATARKWAGRSLDLRRHPRAARPTSHAQRGRLAGAVGADHAQAFRPRRAATRRRRRWPRRSATCSGAARRTTTASRRRQAATGPAGTGRVTRPWCRPRRGRDLGAVHGARRTPSGRCRRRESPSSGCACSRPGAPGSGAELVEELGHDVAVARAVEREAAVGDGGRLASVISGSTTRRSSLALGSVVLMASCVSSELHMLRSIARRCSDVRLSLRSPWR